MQHLNKDICSTFFAIFGSIVGVGFATGTEINTFFARFGVNGLIGSLICAILFFLLFSYFFNIIDKYNVISVKDFNKAVFGKNNRLANFVFVLCNFIFAVAMLAGCEAVFQAIKPTIFPIYSFAVASVSIFIVSGGLKIMKCVSVILVPTLIAIFILCLIIYFCKTNIKIQSTSDGPFRAIIFALLFAFSNFMSSIGIICGSKKSTNSKSISFIIALSIFIMITSSILAISNLKNGEGMPLLKISESGGNIFAILYLFVVIFALLTTFVSSIYNAKEMLKTDYNDKKFMIVVLTFSALIISYLGFNNIIKYLYAFAGLLATIYCLLVVIKTMKHKL